MKKNLLIYLFILLTGHIAAQQCNFNFSVGYGMYSHDDLKKFQQEALEAIPELPVKSVTTFPPFLYFTGSAEYNQFKDLYGGLDLGFYSTGGLNHLADYSGEYAMKIKLYALKAGAHVRQKIYSKRENTYDFGIFVQAGAGIMRSLAYITEYLVVNDYELFRNSVTVVSLHPYVEPSLLACYKVNKMFSVDISAGYQFDFESMLHLKGDKESILMLSDETAVCVNWSGLRISLGLNYTLPIGNKKNPGF
jgi:hypothetical protein